MAASGPMDDYGHATTQGDHHYSSYGDEDSRNDSSPSPSIMSTQSGKASYQEHKKSKFSRNGGVSPSPSRKANGGSTFRRGIGAGGSFSNLLIHDDYRPLMDELKDTYRRKIRPLETTYNFEGFHSAPLTDIDIESKPIVLLLGQYSTVWIPH